jgi:hypothetical protein
MKISYKNTDKDGRLRLGHQYAAKQWQQTELDDGSVVLVPMIPATDKEAMSIFESALIKHKKTIDALK